MVKRKKCPKCGRDTWSEKWASCTSCGNTLSTSGATWNAVANAQLAKAMADAAGDKRQEKRDSKLVAAGSFVIDEPTVTVPSASATTKSFQPTAEEVAEQGDGPLVRPEQPILYESYPGTTTNEGPDLMPPARPQPGETCALCGRKVPKSRAVSQKEYRKRRKEKDD